MDHHASSRRGKQTPGQKSGSLLGLPLSSDWYCGFINHRLATTFAIRGAFLFLFLLSPDCCTPARERFSCSRRLSIDSDDQGVLSGIANVLASCAVLPFYLPVIIFRLILIHFGIRRSTWSLSRDSRAFEVLMMLPHQQ
jgi:hypothetical protein